MVSKVIKVNNEGKVIISLIYTLGPKEALVASLEQQNNNYNTWEYSKSKYNDLITESSSGPYFAAGNYFYHDKQGNSYYSMAIDN